MNSPKEQLIMNIDKLKTIAAFVGIYIVWGTTFLAITFGLKGFPPFLLSGLRFLIAGILLFLMQLLRGEKANSKANWTRNAFTGLFILVGGTGLLTWAEQYVSSTEACVIEAAGPFLFIAMDKDNWKSYFSKKMVIAGLVTGFVGVLLFVGSSLKNGEELAMKAVGIIVTIISLVLWVTGALLSKKKPASQSIAMNTSQQLLIGGLTSTVISASTGEMRMFNFAAIPAVAWYGLVYLVFFGSIIAYFSYQYLLSIKSAVIVSTHTYVNPAVAVIAGSLLAAEQISWVQIMGLVVILTGVFLTNLDSYRFDLSCKISIGKGKNAMTEVRNKGNRKPCDLKSIVEPLMGTVQSAQLTSGCSNQRPLWSEI